MQDDLPLEVVVAVGCVCGFIILLLFVILLLMCYQRHRALKKCQSAKKTQNVATPNICTQPFISGPTKTQLLRTGNDLTVNDNRPEMTNNQVLFNSNTRGYGSTVHPNSSRSASIDHFGNYPPNDSNVTAQGDNEKNFEMEKIWKRNFSERSLRPLANTPDARQNHFQRNLEENAQTPSLPTGDRTSFRTKKIVHEVIV